VTQGSAYTVTLETWQEAVRSRIQESSRY